MKQVKYLNLAAVFVVLVAGLSGCLFNSMVDSAERSGNFSEPVLSDTIFAIGLPDAALARELGVLYAVAFLGEKNTYLLTEGGEVLLQIATELGGKRMHVSATGSRGLYLKDQSVWGSLSIFFGPAESPDEITAVNRLGFAGPESHGVYEKKILVNGILYPALVLSDEQGKKFKQKRKVTLYSPPDSTPPPSRAVLVRPAAIAADAVTLPVQLLGLGVIAIVLGDRRE